MKTETQTRRQVWAETAKRRKEKGIATLQIRLPAEFSNEIRQRAQAGDRSVNSQIIRLIRAGLKATDD